MRQKFGGISNYEADALKFLHGKPVRFNFDKLDRSLDRNGPILYGEGVFEWSDKMSKEISVRGDIGIFSPNIKGEWGTTQIRESVQFRVKDITRNGEEFGLSGSEFHMPGKQTLMTHSHITGTIISWLGEIDRSFLAAIRYKKHHHKLITDGEIERMREIHNHQIIALREETTRILWFAQTGEVELF